MKKTVSVICIIVACALLCSGCLTFSSQLNEEITQNLAPVVTTTVSNVVETTTVAQSDNQETTTVLSQETTTVLSQETTTNTIIPETTTANTQTQNPVTETTTEASQPAVSDYEVLKSGVFHCKGTMVDASGTAPMEMAFTKDTVYVTTDFDGVSVGMLMTADEMYMLYVDNKTYMELGEAIMKMMGVDKDELFGSMDFGFASFGNLEDADSVTQTTVNGSECTCYEFKKENGTATHIYMDGNSLKGFATVNSSGVVTTANYIDYFSAQVPPEMVSPEAGGYTKQNMVTFMSSLMSVMQ